MRMQRVSFVGIAVLLAAGSVLAQAIPNWSAPSSWTAPKGHMTASAMGDLAGPAPFIPVTPCRVADTRGNGFTGSYGPPALAASGSRDFVITGQCGIPSGATAVSFNFTVTGLTAAGDLRFYNTGGTLPTVSTINWTPSTGVIANAAVVPLGSGGAITVKNDCAATVQLIIDVNGYYTQDINSSEFLGIYGNLGGGGVIYASNSSTSGGSTSAIRGVVGSGGAGASGVLGEYTGSAAGYGVEGNSMTNSNAAGVIGRDQASTPVPFDTGKYYISAGVRGESANGLAVLGLSNYMAGAFQNYDTSNNEVASTYVAWSPYGVYAQTYVAADGAAGVYGSAVAASNKTYGVFGSTSSTNNDAAGVKGSAGSTNLGSMLFVYEGVRGEAGSGFGVLGISNNIGLGAYHTNASTGAYETSVWLASSSTTAIYATGNFSATGAKSFVEPYPTDATKVIKYVALEGPEAGTYFRGKGRIAGGQAIIEVPDTFRMVTDEDGLTVQVTPIGRSVSLSVISYDLNAIVVEGDRDAEFFYLVQGVRRSFKDFQVVQENVEFKPSSATDQMPTGLAAEQKRTLIRTGIYREDGTVNMDTAERLGWAREWRERDEKLKATAEEASAKLTAKAAGQTESTRQP